MGIKCHVVSVTRSPLEEPVSGTWPTKICSEPDIETQQNGISLFSWQGGMGGSTLGHAADGWRAGPLIPCLRVKAECS